MYRWLLRGVADVRIFRDLRSHVPDNGETLQGPTITSVEPDLHLALIGFPAVHNLLSSGNDPWKTKFRHDPCLIVVLLPELLLGSANVVSFFPCVHS